MQAQLQDELAHIQTTSEECDRVRDRVTTSGLAVMSVQCRGVLTVLSINDATS